MRNWKMVLVVLFALAIATAAFADYEFTNRRVPELEALTSTTSGDFFLVYDTSASKGKRISTDNLISSDLFVTGGKNGVGKEYSSSTSLTLASLPYSVILKGVGGAGGLDLTDGGTRLIDGVRGQVLVLKVVAIATGGSWIVTPATTTGFTSVTFDAVGDQATLWYVNDTVGWIVEDGISVTIAVPADNYA